MLTRATRGSVRQGPLGSIHLSLSGLAAKLQDSLHRPGNASDHDGIPNVDDLVEGTLQ